MCNHLAGRAELGADQFGLPYQRLKDDVFFALRVHEVAAPDLG